MIRWMSRCGIRKREEGFSLIEVMVALTIFTAGMMSILALFTAGIALHQDAVTKTKAAMLVERVLGGLEEEIQKACEDSPGYPASTVELAVPSQEQGIQCRVLIYPLEGPQEGGQALSSVLVQVEVRWTARGQEREESFYSIFPWKERYSDRVRKTIQ